MEITKERRLISGILNKLNEHFTEESQINKRANEIGLLVSEFSPEFQKPEGDNEATAKFKAAFHIFRDYQRIGGEKVSPFLKEHFENTAAAYLFALNRQFIPEALFDEQKEKRQIKAAVALLLGHHDHLGTGEGKSSVVFPIAAIIDAIASNNQMSILSTVNTTLLSDLKKNTKKFLGALSGQKALPFEITLVGLKEPEKNPDVNLRQTMIKEALLQGIYSNQTKEMIRNAYWETQLMEQGKKRGKFLDQKHKNPRIILTTERNLVFTYEEDPLRFQRMAPNIYMDEADVPYNRNSPYEQTQETMYFDEEAVRESTFSWLLNYLVTQNLTFDDFELKKGQWQLKETSEERIRNLPLDQLDKDDPAFQSGVGIIAHSLGLTDANEKSQLETSVLSFLKRKVAQMTLPEEPPIETEREDIRDAIVDIGERIAILYNQGGISYIKRPEHKGIKVRDQYLGKVIEGHEFLPEVQIAILALHKDFDFVPQEKKAGRILRYQSFIFALDGRVRCASGALLFPDLLTKKIGQSPFAYFLEQATKKRVILITPPELKTPPAPNFFPSNEEAIEQLVNDTKKKGLEKKPTLIVCWEEGEAEAIYQASVENFGSQRVAFVSSEPNPEEEKRVYGRLAEGEIDFVVSSGASGLGVDIKKGDGSFPDLRVALFNFPLNRLQVLQALARRRLPGDDFSWYVAYPALERLVSHFKYRESPIKRFLGATDIETITNEINASANYLQKRLEIVMKLLQRSESVQISNDSFVVAFDDMVEIMIQKGQTFARNYLKQQGVDATRLDWFVHEYGLPETLYHDLQNEASFVSDAANIKDLIAKLVQRLKKNPYDLSSWLASQKKRVDDFFSIIFRDGQIQNAYLIEHQPVKPELGDLFHLEMPQGSGKAGWGYLFLGVRTQEGRSSPVKVLAYRNEDGRLFLPTALQYNRPPLPIDFGVILGKQIDLVPLSEPRFLLFASQMKI